MLDESEVKSEPIDVPAEDEVPDNKESLHTDLGFDAMNEGDSLGDNSAGGSYADSQMMSGMAHDDGSQALAGSSGFQGVS